ncbi:MAG: hypothetical protein ABL999_04305 [Pyrinomonadaceae bacterium]
MTIFLDVAPLAGGIGVAAAVVFFLVLLAAAFIAFKMLKKMMKMAFRMIIVAVILAIAIAGSIALWAFSGSGSSDRPKVSRPR